MLQSQLFTKTQKHPPADEISVNAKLLEQAGFVSKFMAGVYIFLPLGLRVLKKIKQLVREELAKISSEELFMTTLQPKELWNSTGRWELLKNEMYQFKDLSGRDLGLAATHEEPITWLAKKFINSYQDLPKAVYQIQTKFRDAPRAKSGLMRSREFIMKDLYSFHESPEDLEKFYEKVKNAYLQIFKKLGLPVYVTEASGGVFSKKISHEFQVLSDAGEDTIIYCSKHKWAQNKEGEFSKFKAGDKCPKGNEKLQEGKSIEVGNIFNLGTKYSQDLGLKFKDKDGHDQPVWQASYGLGITRTIAALVEVFHDDKGIIWPKIVSPFDVHLIWLSGKPTTRKFADKIYNDLKKSNIEVLYDDRNVSAGEKFVDSDLIGISYRLVVSDKAASKNSVEVKERNKKVVKLLKVKNLLKLFK